MPLEPSRYEAHAFELLIRVRPKLFEALRSLKDGNFDNLVTNYLAHKANHIHRASEAYIVLRETGRLPASRLLIRPVIEAAFRLLAVEKKPAALFQIAYSEYREERKWLKQSAESKGYDSSDALKACDDEWIAFKLTFANKHSSLPMLEIELSAFDAAREGGVGAYYEAAYRMYCQFTHGTFRATSGSLDDFSHYDSRTMVYCTLIALSTARSLGADVPDEEALWQELVQYDD